MWVHSASRRLMEATTASARRLHVARTYADCHTVSMEARLLANCWGVINVCHCAHHQGATGTGSCLAAWRHLGSDFQALVCLPPCPPAAWLVRQGARHPCLWPLLHNKGAIAGPVVVEHALAVHAYHCGALHLQPRKGGPVCLLAAAVQQPPLHATNHTSWHARVRSRWGRAAAVLSDLLLPALLLLVWFIRLD